MDLIKAIKSLTPVTKWETITNPTGQIAGAKGDKEYQKKTEIGRHGNHIYQVLHYAGGKAILCIDLVDPKVVPTGVEGFTAGGVVDLEKMVGSVEGYKGTLILTFGPDGEVVDGRLHQ